MEESPTSLTLSLFLRATATECFVGAATLACKTSDWSDQTIQEQLAVAKDKRVVADLRKEEFSIGTYSFSDGLDLCNLESLLVRLAPTRILYCCSGGKPVQKQLQQLFQNSAVAEEMVAACKANLFGTDSIEMDVRRLIGETGPSGIDVQSLTGDRKMAGGALACLVRKKNLMYDDQHYGHYHLSSKFLNQYVRLDAAAAKALNLFPEPRGAKHSSLFGVLDHCQTRMGANTLHRWVRHPLVDVTEIERRHGLVEIFHQDSGLREALRQDELKGIPDLSRIVLRLKRGQATLKDLWDLRKFAQRLPKIVAALNAHDGTEASQQTLSTTFTSRLASLLEEFSLYVAFTDQAIDIEAAGGGHLRVNPSLSKELQELKRQIEEVDTKIHDYLDRELPRQLPKKVPPNTLKRDKPGKHDDGWSLRVNKSFQKHVPGIPGYREIKIVKAGIVFTTNKLRGYTATWKELQLDYKEMSKEFEKQAVTCAVSYLPVIELATIVLSELDVFVSLAHTAAFAMGGEYVKPRMTALGQKGNIVLKQARHPCMECNDGMNFIPNDYSMDREKNRFVIVTGPNMGGKSTYIRQLGVIAVMAQIGSFVPADVAHLPVVDSVLARVGAGDAQLKGISTFMAEMLEAGAIINAATEDSLILVDELGRGTSTYDGFGLAWAIGEKIVQQGSLCMFATHFHELTALAEETEGVGNLHATAATTATSITMKYEMQEGPCDRSFGIHVAELAQFPSDVVEQARFKARELENLGGPGMESSSALSSAKKEPTNAAETTALTNFLVAFANGSEDAAALAAHVKTLVATEEGKTLSARLVGTTLASP